MQSETRNMQEELDSFEDYGNRNGVKCTGVKSRDMQIDWSPVPGWGPWGGTHARSEGLAREIVWRMQH